MSIKSELMIFQPSGVSQLADGPGVFELLSGRMTILLEYSEHDVKALLREHQSGKHGTCTKIATHFRCESHKEPEARCKELLESYKEETGKLPRCNK